MFIGICSRSQVSVYRTIGPLVITSTLACDLFSALIFSTLACDLFSALIGVLKAKTRLGCSIKYSDILILEVLASESLIYYPPFSVHTTFKDQNDIV